MCDYSLTQVKSRPAKVGDRLRTYHFGTGTRGFCAPGEPGVAVCVLPGTELAFDKEVTSDVYASAFKKTAIFRQINQDFPNRHHDALEFPDGKIILLTHLRQGQMATVLQLPAKPRTKAQRDQQTRAVFV